VPITWLGRGKKKNDRRCVAWGAGGGGRGKKIGEFFFPYGKGRERAT